MGKHQKHTKLTKPQQGQFAREEWAILGTPCGHIQQLAGQLVHRLSEKYSLVYVDADHQSGEATQHPGLKAGAGMVYTDKISHHQLEWKGLFEPFQRRPLYNSMDAVLVNGNHFIADRQIVVLHPKKKDSLQRKLDRLTNVRLILTTGEQSEPWDFLGEHIEGVDGIPTLPFQDFEGIANWLVRELEASLPPVYGLVLTGGKSQRMGTDKGELDYHGKPQRDYLGELLVPFCKQVFLSRRPDQDMPTDLPVIEDTFTGLGPFGAILSAFREHPNAAWLVVACDLPLLDRAGLQQLLDARNRSKVATAFHNPATDFPDPLATIWEPRSYSVLLQFLSQGYSCARKVLINSEIETVYAQNPEILRNVNTPEELEAVKRELGTVGR